MAKSFWTRLRRWFPGAARPPRVSVLRLAGTIGAAETFRGGLTLSGLAQTLASAFEAPGIKAVALVINSPGGSAVQSGLIHDRIRALAAENKVPVFAFAEDVAASGGYMLALGADEIFAHPHAIIGSIGVVSGTFGFDKLIGRFGIDRRVYTAGKSKAMLDPFQPEREEEVARLKSILAGIHKGFIALVRARRGDRLKGTEDELFNGAFWTAETAREFGLIDGLGDVRAVMRARFGDDVELEVYAPRTGFRLFGRRDPGVLAASPQAWLTALEDRAHWARYGL